VLGVAAVAAIAAGLVPGIAALGVALGLVGVYERCTPKPDLRSYDAAPPRVAELFDIHGARAVCMGHTHRPFGHWYEGPDGRPRFRGNSGAWCPAFHDALCTQPVLPARPLLLLTSEGDELHGGLFWWDGKNLSRDRQGAVPPALAAPTWRSPSAPPTARSG
jgi:hypothetical protein